MNILQIITTLLILPYMQVDATILATYKDGKISKSDLYYEIKQRSLDSNQLLKNKNKQISLVKKIVLDRIIFKETEQLLKSEKNEEFNYYRKMVYDVILSNITSDFLGNKFDSNAYLTDLENAKDVKKYFNNIEAKQENILFSIGDNTFTVKDFNKYLDMYKQMGKEPHDDSKFDKKGKEKLLYGFFQRRLIAREGEKLNLHKDERFLSALNQILIEWYKYKVLLPDIIITDKEIIEEYNKNKETLYSIRMLQNNKDITKVLPLDKELKAKIQLNIKRIKINEIMKKIEEDILKKNDYKIYEDRFERK